MSSFLWQQVHGQLIPAERKGTREVPDTTDACSWEWQVTPKSFQLTVRWPNSHNRAGLLRQIINVRSYDKLFF